LKSPDEETVPQVFVQVEAVLAVNCCVAPSFTVALMGLSVKAPPVVGAVIVSKPYAVYCGAVVAMASMVQLEPAVPLAVYNPVELMVPHFAVQVTGMLAENCCVLPWGVLADDGVITIGETTLTVAVALPLPLVAVAVTLQVVEG
jgi:hypothetical protein